MEGNTTGANNTAVGRSALACNTTAAENTAVGCKALTSNTTGAANTAVGLNALLDATTSANNTAVGVEALQNITTGGDNTAMGRASGETITTGSSNVLVGMNAQANANNTVFEVVIGKNATGKGTNTGIIGGNGNAIYQGNNSSTWSTTSDKRIKKNIVDNNIGLDKINKIQVRNFEYRTVEEITDLENPKAAVAQKKGIQLGVIAQEIETILPDVVRTESSGVKSVDPSNLTWYMINAIKELKKEIDLLKNK